MRNSFLPIRTIFTATAMQSTPFSHFYADKAENHNIRLDVKIQMSDTPVIPETEFCVLLGNLLENALDACQTGRPESETSQPFIRVCAVQTGTSTLSITVDNTSVFKPTWINEKLVSTKAAGSGTAPSPSA